MSHDILTENIETKTSLGWLTLLLQCRGMTCLYKLCCVAFLPSGRSFTCTSFLPQPVCKHSWANMKLEVKHTPDNGLVPPTGERVEPHSRECHKSVLACSWRQCTYLLPLPQGMIWLCVNSQNAIFIGNTMPRCCGSLNIENRPLLAFKISLAGQDSAIRK